MAASIDTWQGGTFRDPGEDATDLLHAQGAAWLAIRSSETGYVVITPQTPEATPLRVADERDARSGFVAGWRIAEASAVDGRDAVEATFQLERVSYLEMLRRRDAALADRDRFRAAMRSDGPARVTSVRVPSEATPVYGEAELAIECDGEWVNPFDPADVQVDAVIRTPSGRELRVPGFYLRDFSRARVEGREVLEPTGVEGWRVRFAPTEPGRHVGRIVLDDGESRAESEPFEVHAVASDAPGFVRISDDNPLYFALENGELFFPIGLNVGWSSRGGTYEYDHYLERIASHGGNFVRVWLGPTFHNMSLEVMPSEASEVSDAGLGWIDLEAAWRVDHLLREAARRGIRVMPAIESFSGFRDSGPPRNWPESPYNIRHGGPLADTFRFLTDPSAKELFKRRLRYIVARWGHSTAIHAWELWNEANGIDGYDSAASASWHREMAAYLKSLDPYGHPVTTSFWIHEGDEAVDSLPEIDFVQTHHYGAQDLSEVVTRYTRRKIEKYGKPHLFGEFGISTSGRGASVDPVGVHMHNAMWASLMAGSAGGAMIWWWDSYVDPNGLYRLFDPLARFVDGLPLHRVGMQPIESAAFEYVAPPRTPRRATVLIEGHGAQWQKHPMNEPRTFTIHPDGSVSDAELLSSFLHGTGNHPEWTNPQTFDVTFDRPGEFVVRVLGVSGHGGANLRVELDGQVVLERTFPDENSDSTQTIHRYDGDYAVHVPAGRHRIRVSNDGADWIELAYELPDFIGEDRAPLTLTGLWRADAPEGELAAIWRVRDRAFTWSRRELGDIPAAVDPTRLTLSGFEQGNYHIEWWDTADGRVVGEQIVAATGDGLTLRVPMIHDDLAAKLFRVSPGTTPTATGVVAQAMTSAGAGSPPTRASDSLAQQARRMLHEDMLAHWYPASIDYEHGGFHQNLGRDWTVLPDEDRFLVYQARMTWVAAKAAAIDPRRREMYLQAARHGLVALRDVLRDAEHGGLFFATDLDGRPTTEYGTDKHAYGIAFAIYAAAAVHEATGDDEPLELAKQWFAWLDRHAHDPEHGGYFESLDRAGTPRPAPPSDARHSEETPILDAIGHPFGYKSMNGHIHLLEAFAELYHVWPDATLRDRLEELLTIVRDRIAVEPGCLNLLFTPDWRALPMHDSFGHDVETAYLLVEAATALGMPDDPVTWRRARQLIDHALVAGWDREYGGFFERGQAFGDPFDTSKVWWTQAEGLNALLLMHERFGGETPRYWHAFGRQWDFIVQHQVDDLHGGWYAHLTRDGRVLHGREKATRWKAAYHTVRAVMNVAETLDRLEPPGGEPPDPPESD